MTRDLASATFRRAEGLRIHGSACEGFAEFRVAAHREGGGTEAVVTRDEAALLCRLNRWQTADEAGATLEVIEPLVEADFVFFSHGRPRRDLSEGKAPRFDGPIALRRNVSFTPLVASEDDPDPRPIPFMPRRGELDGLALVGFEFAVNEMETETHSISIACCAKHGRELRDLIPRLTGEFDGDALASVAWVRPLLEALSILGLLEARQQMRTAGARESRVTWLCHAAVLIESVGRRVLVDPLEYPCSVPSRHPVLPPDWRDIGPRVSAILVTHGDNDHLNPRTLCRFTPDTLVYIPAPQSIEPYQVDMEALLALLGFEQVKSVREWDRIQHHEITIVATPFRGEDWGLALASVAYIVSSPQLTVYLNADSTSTPDAYDRIASEFAIDLACVGVTGASEAHVMPPGYGYGHFYAPWIPDERRNEWVQLCNGPEESAEVARRLKARFAFGYAAGGAPFAAQAYTDRGTHEELAAILARHDDGPKAFALPLGEAVSCPKSRS